MFKNEKISNSVKSLTEMVDKLKNEVLSLISPSEKATESIVKLTDFAKNEKPSEYENEITQIKELIVQTQKFSDLKQRLNVQITDNSQKEQLQSLSKSFEDTLPVLSQMGLDATDFAKIFNSSFDRVLTKSQSFSQSMKSLMDDLKRYFIKSLAESVSSSIFNSVANSNFLSSLSGFSSGGFGISGMLRSFLGIFSGIKSHHTGGVIPSGVSYTLPGTQEYLALLKGGERVLSPSENASFSKDDNQKNKIVVNNFNVKAWDAKDVQQYLIENKNLLASITAENIKYNNANLRYMTGGA